MKTLTGGIFSKLDDLGMGFGVSNKIRISLETKECLFFLSGKSDSMDRRSNLVPMVKGSLPKLTKNFLVSFLIPKEQMRYYLNMCSDKDDVAEMLKYLYSTGHQFYFCSDFYDALVVEETQVNVPDMIEELTSNSKTHYRGKKFIRELVDEGTLVIPKDKKAIPEKIPLDFKIVSILNSYGLLTASHEKHRSVLLKKACFTKVGGNSKCYAPNGTYTKIDLDFADSQFTQQLVNQPNSAAIHFCEQLGFKFVENEVYLRLTATKFFNEIGS